jgi:heme-degrading monooxygenase HmoA
MIVTIFRSRLRPEHADQYAATAARIHDLATRQPGFVSIRSYTAADGERVSIVLFESWQTHDAWRNHPEHREAQRLGRERYYSEFSIEVGEVDRQYTFHSSAEQR